MSDHVVDHVCNCLWEKLLLLRGGLLGLKPPPPPFFSFRIYLINMLKNVMIICLSLSI